MFNSLRDPGRRGLVEHRVIYGTVCHFLRVSNRLIPVSASEEIPELSRAARRKLELRREIIEAAFDCFAERGYHATGIADIAARLGIGHGTFYRYFENKRDIVEHVITDLIEKVIATLAAENAPDAVSTLEEYRVQTERIGEALDRIFGEDPRVARMLLLEAPGIDKEMGDRILGFFEMATALTASYLAHGVEFGLPARRPRRREHRPRDQQHDPRLGDRRHQRPRPGPARTQHRHPPGHVRRHRRPQLRPPPVIGP
jgi:AcrR family transcriptional regulator